MGRRKKEKDEIEEYIKKVERARKERDEYVYNGIRKVRSMVPKEKLDAFESQYPADSAMRFAKRTIAYYGVREGCSYHDSCISDAGLVYMYSVCRCVYCGYENFWGYYYRMIYYAIIWNYYLKDDVTPICKKNSLKPVYLDSENVNL